MLFNFAETYNTLSNNFIFDKHLLYDYLYRKIYLLSNGYTLSNF